MLSRFFGGGSNSTGYQAFKDQSEQGGAAASTNNVAGAKAKLASATSAPGFSFGGKKPEPKPRTQATGADSTPLLGR